MHIKQIFFVPSACTREGGDIKIYAAFSNLPGAEKDAHLFHALGTRNVVKCSRDIQRPAFILHISLDTNLSKFFQRVNCLFFMKALDMVSCAGFCFISLSPYGNSEPEGGNIDVPASAFLMAGFIRRGGGRCKCLCNLDGRGEEINF